MTGQGQKILRSKSTNSVREDKAVLQDRILAQITQWPVCSLSLWKRQCCQFSDFVARSGRFL